ncbi:reverse transcriptase domain-containing protein [Tanacetum coccineum]
MELISQKSELSLKSVKLIQPILPLMNLLRLNSRNCLPISRIFGKFFPKLLSRLDHSFKCEDTNLSLLEKSHLMVKEGIGPSTGHKISKKGIEVRQSKIEVICKIPSLHHRQKELGVFLEYSILFRRLAFELFQTLRDRLTEAPILGIAPQTGHLPFELMCDASDFAIGAVLGQRHEKHFRPIHYASKTLIEAQTNYTTTEKELLAIVYAFEKFRSYLINEQKHRSGYHQKDRKPSQNDKTEHGMEKTVQNQGQSPEMSKSESILKNQQSNRSRN